MNWTTYIVPKYKVIRCEECLGWFIWHGDCVQCWMTGRHPLPFSEII